MTEETKRADRISDYCHPAHPQFQFWFRPIPGSVWNWARDRCWRKDDLGVQQFDLRLFSCWLVRFATDDLEGVVWKGNGRPPEFNEQIKIMTRTYPLLSQDWFDKLPHDLMILAGMHLQGENTLTIDEKKTSDSPRSGDSVEGTTESGIAGSATSSEETGTDTTETDELPSCSESPLSSSDVQGEQSARRAGISSVK